MNKNMKIKIIIPIYPFDGHKDFMYPEAYKTPIQQVEWLKEIINDEKITSKEELVIVTTSPYIAEGLCKITKLIKEGDNFGEKEEVIFFDGKNELTREQFFHHFADAMILLFDDITPNKKNISIVCCKTCCSQDIKHEKMTGRGLPPKSYNPPKLMPKPRTSWRGIWDVYTCNNCGETWKKLCK